MAANIAVGFQLTANAAGMSQGINAGVVELQKLGLAAKQTSQDVRLLTGIQLGTSLISGVRAITSTFSNFTSGAASSIDQTNKLSTALGISFAELQRLQLAADLSGASAEQLSQAFIKAQLTINRAAQGTPQAVQAIRALGLSVDEIASQSSSQQFELIASAIAKVENPAARSAAAVSVFGEEGAKLLPVFQELSQNLRQAEGFFSGFRSQLGKDDADKVTAINDAFTLVQQSITQTAGKLLAELQPALTAGARSVQQFLQGLDVTKAAASVSRSLESMANAAKLLVDAVGPVLQRPLVAVGAVLVLINRQKIATAIDAAATAFRAAKAAAAGYALAAGGAAAGTALLKGAIRSALASTGIGLLAVGLGFAAEAAVNYASKTGSAAEEVKKELQSNIDAIEDVIGGFTKATTAAQAFGAKVQAAIKIPNLSLGDIAQDSINSAQSAIAGLAKELGGTVNVPRELVAQFNSIQNLAERANGDFVNQRVLLTQLVQESNRFADSIKAVTERRQADTRAAEQAAEAARKAAEEARKRTSDLAFEGLGGVEQSRLKLAEDLLQIDRERQAAEAALAAARRAGDNAGIGAARERLSLVRDAVEVAREQDRQRQLQALGIDNNLLRPAQTIADEFAKVREAFRRGLIDPDEAKNALRNLADEGIKIRRDLNAELSRPSQRALEVQDIRSGGIAEFLRLATGREDPAVEQNRQQLQELARIRQGLERIGVRPVDILGS